MMDSAEKGEHRDCVDTNVASASTTESPSCEVRGTPDNTIQEVSSDMLHSDLSEAEGDEPVTFTGQEAASSQVGPGGQNSNADPSAEPQLLAELHREQLYNSGGNEHMGSMDPDLEQFYRMSAQKYARAGMFQEGNYDDLPLSFSFQPGEDDSSKVYTCSLCNFKTAFKNSLVNHQAVHSDARPWICEVCDYAAKRKQDLKKHLQTMHGMIVESLALKPGFNPLASSVSSSGGLGSPVDIKPVIANNTVVSGDQCGGSGMSGVGTSHTATSASLLSQLQGVTGFGQPLPSSAKMNPVSRPLPMPVVGKFIADKFPFNQFCPEGGTAPNRAAPRLPPEKLQAGFKVDSDNESGDGDLSLLDGAAGRQFHLHRDMERVNGLVASQKFHGEGKPLEDREGRRHSGSELLSQDGVHQSSVFDDRGFAKMVDAAVRNLPMSTSKSQIRQEGHSSAAFWQQLQGHNFLKRKRESTDSWNDTITKFSHGEVSAKTSRFQSTSSDTECCPQVSSQSDVSGNAEPISSSVSYSRALETKKSFHCAHCDILFFENALYLMHMGLHDSSNPWKCSICGRTFFEKYSFTSHFINQH